ncbi:MAG: DUF5131 family protein [Planctomycetota bacterium]|jgi:protein gp37
MARSSIEWLNRPGTTPETWNPVVGCSPVSRGCDNCWAGKYADRLEALGQEAYTGTSLHGKFHGVVNCDASVLDKPLHWRRPRTVAVCLMGDLLHKAVPLSFLVEVHARMWLKWQSTFIVLTKRAGRMRRVYHSDEFWEAVDARATEIGGDMYRTRGLPLANLWAMVSCEDQKTYDQRVPYLNKINAAVVGLSVEPMLGPIALPTKPGGPGWVMFGAESINGRAGRVCKHPWIASGVLACKSAGVPAFVKQVHLGKRISKKPAEWPRQLRVRQWPKGMA